MYIYNVTINIDESIHDEWIIWIETHINKVLETGRFLSAKLTEVLVEEDMGGTTYAVQYTAKTRQDLDDYYKFDADKLRQDGLKKFGDKVLVFRTELRLVNEFFPAVTSN
jgi:hypothetical protein